MRFLILALSLWVGLNAAGCNAEPLKPLKPLNPAKPAVNVLVFTATWCGPCRRQHPEVVVLKARGLVMHEYDWDTSPVMRERWKVSKVPTYIVREGRDEVWRTNDVNDLWKLLK